MKIKLTNPITGKSKTYRARLTTDSVESSYGLPVIELTDYGVLDISNAIMQGAIVTELPKSKQQIEMLNQWRAHAATIAG